MIHLRNKHEIAEQAKAGRLVAEVFRALEKIIKPGITTREIDELATEIICSAGAIPTFLHYGRPPFPANICVSVDDEVVHGIPSEKRVLRSGSIVSVDVGATLNGWIGDAARTYFVGDVPEEVRRLVAETETAFWKGMAQALPGNRLGDISAAIQAHAESFSYGVVRELSGHGVGRKLHEDPSIPNFGRAGRGPRLEVGMVLAVEPMINLGTAAVERLDDGWTIVTADGKPSAHYENTFAITEEGPLILTSLDGVK